RWKFSRISPNSICSIRAASDPVGPHGGPSLYRQGPARSLAGGPPAQDGRLAIDDDVVERRVRNVTVGRENRLFAGSPEGAQRAAALHSIICTSGLQGVEPWTYLIAPGRRTTVSSPRMRSPKAHAPRALAACGRLLRRSGAARGAGGDQLPSKPWSVTSMTPRLLSNRRHSPTRRSPSDVP